jgi:hypothetical protein
MSADGEEPTAISPDEKAVRNPIRTAIGEEERRRTDGP